MTAGIILQDLTFLYKKAAEDFISAVFSLRSALRVFRIPVSIPVTKNFNFFYKNAKHFCNISDIVSENHFSLVSGIGEKARKFGNYAKEIRTTFRY